MREEESIKGCVGQSALNARTKQRESKQRNGGKMRTGSNEKKKEYIHENDSS